MKAKITRGKSFGGVCRYVEDVGKQATGKKKPELIYSTLMAQTTAGRIHELTRIAATRPDVEKPVWHCSLSLPPGEHLSADKWAEVVRDFISGMGMDADRQPYFVVRHHDTQHEHVHIVLCRVREDGQLFYGQKEAVKAIKVTQSLEVKHGLKETRGLRRTRKLKASLKTTEIEKAPRIGKAPPRQKLQVLIDEALETPKSAALFVTTLEMAGVGVIPALSPSGKLNGFTFEKDGFCFKGSELGKDYGLKGLLSRGLTYDKAREFGELNAAGNRCRSRIDQANAASGGDHQGVSRADCERGREEGDGNSTERGVFERRDRPDVENAFVNSRYFGGGRTVQQGSLGGREREQKTPIEGITTRIVSGDSVGVLNGRSGGNVLRDERAVESQPVADGGAKAEGLRDLHRTPQRSHDGLGTQADSRNLSEEDKASGKSEERREINVTKHAHKFPSAYRPLRQRDARLRACLACLAAGFDLQNVPSRSGSEIPRHQSRGDGDSFFNHPSKKAFSGYLERLVFRGLSVLKVSCSQLAGYVRWAYVHLRWTNDAGASDVRGEKAGFKGALFIDADSRRRERDQRTVLGEGRQGDVDVLGLSGGLRSMASSAHPEGFGSRSTAEERTRSAAEPKRRRGR